MLTAIITLALIIVFLYVVPFLHFFLVDPTDGRSLYVATAIFEKLNHLDNCALSHVLL